MKAKAISAVLAAFLCASCTTTTTTTTTADGGTVTTKTQTVDPTVARAISLAVANSITRDSNK